MEKLRSTQQLGTLTVSSPKVTDAGLAHVAQAKSLISVNLTGCSQVTKEGVMHLTALPELIDLTLTGTKVTDEDVEELKELIPKRQIFKGCPDCFTFLGSFQLKSLVGFLSGRSGSRANRVPVNLTS